MIANYHTHTKRCRHAVGTDEEFVQAALERGLKILGFSDHTPYPFPGDYYSTFRMFPEELADYVNSILGLREKYADKIQIFLGLETEYYPAHFENLRELLKDYPIDYMLLGQHALGNEKDEYFCGWPTEDVSILKRYVDQTMEGMNTGCFNCFAHPDLINFVGDPKIYKEQMRNLIREAKSCNVSLEFNMVGLWTGRIYPNRLFWEMVAEEGAPAIQGIDAHNPPFLKEPDVDPKAAAYLEGLDIPFLDKLPLTYRK